MTVTLRQLGLREVLQIEAVRRLWIAQIVSVFGDFLAIFAALSHASFNLNAGPTQVMWISISVLIPFALMGPVIGVFVDRWNIKRTMIASDLIRAVLALLLVLAGGLGWIYVILFLLGATSTFFIPAQTVAIRAITPQEGLISANALMQQAVQMVRIISPVLAGAMVGWFGATSCYLIDSLSFLISAAMISTILISREPAARAEDVHPIHAITGDLWAVVKLIFTRATLTFAILAMTAAGFAISCFAPLIAIFVRDQLKSGRIVFGIVNSLIGIGMIAGTLTIGRLARRRTKSHLIRAGLLMMGGGILLMGTLRNIPAGAIGVFGIGFGVTCVLVSAQTMIQVLTPSGMVGRASSSFWALLSIAQLTGLAISSSIVQRIGITYLFNTTAGMLILIAVWGCFSLPQERTEATYDRSI